MTFSLYVAVAALGLYFVYSFLANISAVRRSGIRYVIIPFQPHTYGSRLTYPLWSRVLPYLPESSHLPYFMHPDFQWNKLHSPFKRLGTDTVILCSPGQLVLYTCGADEIRQIISRKEDFPKPWEIYKIVDIFGPSIISTEGMEWRKHRKTLAVIYTHKTYNLAWDESIRQFQALLQAFVGDEDSSRDLRNVDKCINQSTLAVISRAGYGVPLKTLSEEGSSSEDDAAAAVGAGDDSIFHRRWIEGKTHGHTLSYPDSIRGITSNILWIAGIPRPILKMLPVERAKQAYKAYQNWGQYMREMIGERRRIMEIENDDSKRGSDLLSSLVKSTGDAKNEAFFTDEELLADMFITIIGGHKTIATTIRFGLVLLAMNVSSQRNLQADIDKILQGKKPEDWSYEEDFSRLFKGMPGAAMAEVLRWVPPIPGLPKLATEDQELTVEGNSTTVPKGTMLAIDAAAAHRNPKHWPSSTSTEKHDSENGDLDEFKPERWLLSSSPEKSDSLGVMKEAAEITTDDVDGVYKPVSGSYLPFSAGGRICLGRQFAQAECMVAFALIFREFSVELSVDRWASDAEVGSMGDEGKRSVWQKARDEAHYKFRNNIECLLSADMTGEPVPIRFVRRGKERFNVC